MPGQGMAVSIHLCTEAAGSDGPLVQVPSEMATTAASTAKRARIINNVGNHCLTGPSQFREAPRKYP